MWLRTQHARCAAVSAPACGGAVRRTTMPTLQPSNGSNGGNTTRRLEGGRGAEGGAEGRSVSDASLSAIHHQSLDAACLLISASSRRADRDAPNPFGRPGRSSSLSVLSSATRRCNCRRRASAAIARLRCRSASSINLMTAGQCFGSTPAPTGTAVEAPHPMSKRALVHGPALPLALARPTFRPLNLSSLTSNRLRSLGPQRKSSRSTQHTAHP
jgi:hypothetical protein